MRILAEWMILPKVSGGVKLAKPNKRHYESTKSSPRTTNWRRSRSKAEGTDTKRTHFL